MCFWRTIRQDIRIHGVCPRNRSQPGESTTLTTMKEPVNIKGVQQLTGRLAALSHFISRLGERTLPFYQLLRKGEKINWTEEARNAFANLKKTLSTHLSWQCPRSDCNCTSTWQHAAV